MQSRGCGVRAGFQFVANGIELFNRGTDEEDVSMVAGRGEFLILRKKTVPGMNRLGLARNSGGDDRFNIQIAGRGIGGPNANCTVSQSRPDGIQIGFGCSQYGFNAEALASSNHAHGDFAAIGDQDAPQRHAAPGLMRISTESFSANCALSQQISTTSPRVSA